MDDIVLAVLKNTPVQKMQYTSDGGFHEVAAIQSPRQLKTARALDDWVLTVKAFKGDGMKHAEALRAKQKQQAPVMITDGTGKSWGQWTLKTIKTEYTRLIDNLQAGELIIHLTLKEWRQDEGASTI
nr:phage tail protein [Vibrio sp. S9_S30]